MAFTRKKLAFIQLPSSEGTIYDPPASTKGLIHNIILHNINTSEEVVVIKMNDGTNTYILWNIPVPSNETVVLDFSGEGIVIDDASSLVGVTTTASKVTCFVCGSEEPV
jgi:hypothetical protein